MINLFKLMNLLASICNLFLIFAITKSNLRKISKYTFSILLVAISSFIWSLNMALLLFFANNSLIAEFLCRLNWIGGFIVASYTFSSLVTSFNDEIADIISIIQFIIAGIFLFLAFTKLGIKEVISVFPLKRISGSAATLFRIWIVISVLYSLYLSLKNYFNMENSIEKIRHKYYIFSLFVYSIFGVIFVGILPLLGYENYIYLTPIGSVFWVLGLFYSAQQYKVVDIDIFLSELVGYSFFILFGVFINIFLIKLFLSFNLTFLASSILSVVLTLTFYYLTLVKTKEGRFDNVIKSVILHKRVSSRKLVEDIARAIVEILDLENLLRYVVHQLHISLGVSKVAIFLREEDDTYRLAVGYGLKDLKTVYLKNQRIINWLKRYREPFLIDLLYSKLDNKEEIKQLVDDLQIFGAIVVVPILYKREELLGIITLDQKKADGSVFDQESIEVLQILADQLAIAIKNSMVYNELNEAYMQITRALSLALESKDEYLVGHTDKVTKYAVMLAKKIGLSEKEIYILTQAAMLHDLGKVGVHDYILNKPGKLSSTEWEEIKQHPIKGAKILKTLPFLDKVAEVVLYHHEHYDGSGYPVGLKGEEIPLLAKILTLADAVDAMLSERPYRKNKMSVKEVIEELKTQRGKHFDPYLVDKFIEIIQTYPNLIEVVYIEKNEKDRSSD